MAAILVWAFRDVKILDLTVNQLVVLMAFVIVGFLLPVLNSINPQRRSIDLARKAALAVLGYLAGQLHLKKFDKRYLEYGSMNRLRNLKR